MYLNSPYSPLVTKLSFISQQSEAIYCCSVRFVPDQRPEELVDLLTSLVQKEFKKLNTGNVLSVRVKSVGDWWEADPKSKFFCLAESALQKVSCL